ncbi:uncharacterized protein [Littorina saxatilis]|uniref:TGF-beta family profile domain-containing protein n=1 Tax=Littorina saxatilis TaxID=31220 RepID=A0AAN9GAU8_9CAEN
MADHTLWLMTLCSLLVFAHGYASDDSDSSASNYHYQHKDELDRDKLTTTRTPTTTTTTVQPKILNLDKFIIADKIAAAVKEVEEAYNTHQKEGEGFEGGERGEEPLTTDAIFPQGWSTPAALTPLTTGASSPSRNDPHSDLHRDNQEEYREVHEGDDNLKSPPEPADEEDDNHMEPMYSTDDPLSDELMTTSDFASQMQKDNSTSYADAEQHQASSEKPFNEKLVNRPRWYILREKEEEKEQEEETDEQTEESSDESRWPQNRPSWDSSPDNSHSEDGSYDDGERHSKLGSKEYRKDHEESTHLSRKDRTKKKEKTRGKKKTKPSHKRQNHKRKWKSKKKRPTGKDCVGCTKHGATISQARKLHTQILKAQLLDKLRLVPTFTKRPWPPKLPDQVFPDPPQRDHTGYDDQYYAKPTQLLVFGRDLGPRHRLRKAGTGSYQFGLTGKVKGHVTSAALWVYKMKDAHDVHEQTLVITDLHFSKRRRLRERSLVARLDTHVKEGWLRFDVTRLVQGWLKGKTPASLQMLAIRCKTCHRTNYRAIFGVKSNFRPVLVVEENGEDSDDDKRRERREACDPNTRCCKFDLTIQFHDLGVHEILRPRSIKADYCHGFCERPDAYYHNYTLIIQRMRFGSYAPLEAEMFERLRPCCVPVVLREASIMHYINDGLDTQVSVVPNLLVEKCGCA